MALTSKKIASDIVKKRAAHFDPKRREVDLTARLMLLMVEHQVLPSQSDLDALFLKVAMLEPRVHILAETLREVESLKSRRRKKTTKTMEDFFKGYDAVREAEKLQRKLKRSGNQSPHDEATRQISDKFGISEALLRALRTRFRIRP